MKKSIIYSLIFTILFVFIGIGRVNAEIEAPTYIEPINSYGLRTYDNSINSIINTSFSHKIDTDSTSIRSTYCVGYKYITRANFYLGDNGKIVYEEYVQGRSPITKTALGATISIYYDSGWKIKIVWGGKNSQKIEDDLDIQTNTWYTLETIEILPSCLDAYDTNASYRMSANVYGLNSNEPIFSTDDRIVSRNRSTNVYGFHYYSERGTSELSNAYVSNAYSFYEKIPHSISVESVTNGLIAPNKTTAGIDDEVDITVTPDVGYKLKNLTYSYVDSNNETHDVDITNSKKITMPIYDVTLSATFEKDLFEINVDSLIGGIITSSKAAASFDDEIDVTAVPNKGYKLKSLSYSYVDSNNETHVVDITNSKKFVMPVYKVTLSAVFEKEVYVIRFNPFVGATITPNDTVTIEYDGSQIYKIIPNDGYVLKSLLVNNEEKINLLVDNILSLSNIKENIDINLITEAIQYEFTEGKDVEFSGDDLVFRINGDLSLFDKLYINDVEVDAKYYTLKSGSTIITLKSGYLSKFTDGTYTLKATYKNGTDVETTFTVNNDTVSDEEINNPVTGQKIMHYVITLFIALIGIITILFIKSRRLKFKN